MKELILIACLFIATLLGDDIDSTQYKFAIYPELVGLGGVPSLSLEYFVYIPKWSDNSISSVASGNYSIRFGMGIVGASGIIAYPMAIYKVIGKGRSRAELGAGLFISYITENVRLHSYGGDDFGLGYVGALHWRYESKNERMFGRVGLNLGSMLTHNWPIFLPTLGWGIKF